MKKSYIILLLTLHSSYLFSQANTFPWLQVNSTSQSGQIRIGGENTIGSGRVFINADLYNNLSYIDVFGDNVYKLLRIDASPLILNQHSGGNVGIGVQNPQDKLSVKGNIRWGDELNYIYSGQDYYGAWFEQVSPTKGQNTIRLQSSKNGDNTNYSQLFIDANNGFSFQTIGNANGNVGIGISNPSEKLSVNGNIRAKEIKVETANWPDYVFDQDYKILELTELERYITLNKHLPDSPSAATVESNGIAIGDMIKMQQKKIEELTLYIIQMSKELTDQKQQLKALHKS